MWHALQHVLIPSNGTDLHVETWERNGEPLILLHFSDGNAGVWHGVIPYLRDSRWVINIDCRGHGLSAKQERGYTLGNMALDIAGVMDALGVPQADFLGSSMGAEIALRLAAELPGRVRSLVLEQAFQNTFGSFGVHGDFSEAEAAAWITEQRALRAARSPVVGRTPEEAVRTLLSRWGHPWDASAAIARAMLGSIGPREDGQFGLVRPAAAGQSYVEDYWNTRFERDFQRVQCPVLFLPDEASLQKPDVRASMDWFRSLLGESRLTVIPGAEHAAMVITHPAAVAGAAREFYEEVSRRWAW